MTESNTTSRRACLVCGITDQDAPLIQLVYRGESLWICPKHMPTLIHKPEQLVGVLPGAAGDGGEG